jgi:hypothetical protein
MRPEFSSLAPAPRSRSTYITWLPQDNDPRNLAALLDLPHTRFTYHRTWETGLEAEIRVAAFSPDFFRQPFHSEHLPSDPY